MKTIQITKIPKASPTEQKAIPREAQEIIQKLVLNFVCYMD